MFSIYDTIELVRIMKKIYYFFLLLLFLIPIKTLAIVEKSDKEFITDSANLLHEDAEDYIVKYSDFLEKKRHVDYYVVTIRDLDGIELEDYAEQIFQEYKISDKGVLILISKNDRQLRVHVGVSLLEVISPDLVDQYINTYFLPYLEREEWNDGIINGYNAFYKYLCEQYQLDASEMEVDEQLDFITKNKTILMIAVLLFVAVCVRIYVMFYKKTTSNYRFSFVELLALVMLILLNIFAVSFSYLLQPYFILFVLAVEGFSYYSGITSLRGPRSVSKTPRVRKKRIQKKRKKRKK